MPSRLSRRVLLLAAGVIALVGLSSGCGSSSSTKPEDLPKQVVEEGKFIPRYCPICKKAFKISREELESMPGSEPLIVKARKAKCPICGKAESLDAVACVHCGKYFSPADPAAKGGAVCPHCGKDPFTK